MQTKIPENLKELALAANHGNWFTNKYTGEFICTDATYTTDNLDQRDDIACCYGPDGGIDNASFIAAANPSVILELLRQRESLISLLTELKNLASIEYGFDSPIAIRAREAIVALGGEV